MSQTLPSQPQYPAHAGRPEHEVDATWWEEQYRKGEAFWDHGAPSPGLVDFLAQETYTPGAVLVPGCGRGHDCRALAAHGFAVTGQDIAPQAVAEARALAAAEAPSIIYAVGDFLKLPAEFQGQFDWLFEHTCFSALNPDWREQYAASVAAALRRGGHYLGVFYNIQPESGPPFGTTRAELVDRFSPRFSLQLEKVPRSFPNREGKELLMLWRKL